MKPEKRSIWAVVCILAALLLMVACSLSPGSDSGPDSAPALTPTPTPTVLVVQVDDSPPDPSPCAGLSGTFEIQLLVGPSDAVGLEPFAVGEIPFSVEAVDGSYVLTGGGPITYEEVLQEEWGTYSVSFDMDITLSGECGGSEGSEALNVHVVMSGEQMVEVRADGFSGDYPWSGTHEQDLIFPLEEGAAAAGDGWQMVLHLN